jgi:predicted acyl esterase
MGLPPPATDYTIRHGVRVPMRDGVDLIADHYAPAAAARGTLLVRGPYGRAFPFSVLFARVYAVRGYHVVLQSVRGTFGSGGVFEPMINEATDGADTAEWLRHQPWFTGRFATIGPSYLGLTQWALLQEPPPEMAAAVITVGPHDFSASALGTGAPWYEPWLEHPDRDDPFWREFRFDAALDRVDVPVLLIGGWQDTFLEQTLEQYRRLSRRGIDVALTVGPWTHAQLTTTGAAAVARESLQWLDTHLAGTAAAKRSPVRIFIPGDGWVDLPGWPPAMPERVLYLRAGGALAGTPPADTSSPSTFQYDPGSPTPTIGGRLLSPEGGYRDDSRLCGRADVLAFTGDVLPSDLYMVGSPVVELSHAADNPHVDVFVRVSEVDGKGRSRNVSDGYRRVIGTDKPSVVRIELDATAHRLRAGSRIRLLIAGGSHPRFARNLGTGEPAVTARTMATSHHAVHHRSGALSRLVLPAGSGPPSGEPAPDHRGNLC